MMNHIPNWEIGPKVPIQTAEVGPLRSEQGVFGSSKTAMAAQLLSDEEQTHLTLNDDKAMSAVKVRSVHSESEIDT